MRILRVMKWLVVVSALHGIVLPIPRSSAADTGAAHQPLPTMVNDVSLQAGGRLSGEVLNAEGQPVSQVDVLLVDRANGQMHRSVTDDEGHFAIDGLRGGVYRFATANTTSICRCWAPGTAPPAAKDQLLVVSDERIERGQRPLAEALFSTPTLLALMIIAAIAIPIAVHNSKRDAS